MFFSKNWISKNWKSIGIHCWTSINEFIDRNPSMNALMDIHEFIDGPSMNMVPFLWFLSLGPFFGPHWAAFGPHGARATMTYGRGRLLLHGRVLGTTGEAKPVGWWSAGNSRWCLKAQWKTHICDIFHGFSWFFMFFSKNWISKNWKSIDIHCWTPSMNINGLPPMNINGFPSMN